MEHGQKKHRYRTRVCADGVFAMGRVICTWLSTPLFGKKPDTGMYIDRFFTLVSAYQQIFGAMGVISHKKLSTHVGGSAIH